MMDPKQREKCLKEVRLLESLDHPNIIKYLDSFIEGNQLFIAIEWAERGDLKKLIKKCIAEDLSIDERRIWEYLYQIGSALKHMQEKRIMHRDLKPANIFIVSDGNVKLGDLGLGRFMSSQTIEAFSRVGTPLYMSPEVLKGNGYDWKSDVWSLGCVIYELACLRSPFKKEDEKMSLYDLFQTINKGEFPPLPNKYSDELRQTVNSMIQILPQNRFSVDQIVELCEIQLKATAKKSRVDPFLVMDDIHEKLKLLNYEQKFCIPTGRGPLSKVYFSQEIDKTEQLRCFSDIAHWLMSLKQAKPLAYLSKKIDPEKIVSNLVADIKTFGVKIPEFFSIESLKNGFGESVCYVVNDLLNKELIRQDYKFNMPIVIENGVECYGDPPEPMEFYEEIRAGTDYFEDKWEDDDVEEVVVEKKDDNKEEKEDIVVNNINPEDWEAECLRVQKRLVIQDNFNLGDDSRGVFRNKIKEIYKTIKDFWQANSEKFLITKSEELENTLDRIQSFEKKLNREYQSDLTKAKEITSQKLKIKDLCDKKRSHISNLISTSEEIEEKLDSLSSNSSSISSNPLGPLKKAHTTLKKDLFSLEMQISIARHAKDRYLNEKTFKI